MRPARTFVASFKLAGAHWPPRHLAGRHLAARAHLHGRAEAHLRPPTSSNDGTRLHPTGKLGARTSELPNWSPRLGENHDDKFAAAAAGRAPAFSLLGGHQLKTLTDDLVALGGGAEKLVPGDDAAGGPI